MLPYALWNLTLTRRRLLVATCKRRSRAQLLCLTNIPCCRNCIKRYERLVNFRKTAMLTSFRQNPTISIRFNLLQNCPSVTTSEFTEAYRCHPTSELRHRTSEIWYPTFDIRHPRFDIPLIWHPRFDIRHLTSDIRDSTSDIRHLTSEIRHPTFERMAVMCSAWDQGTYEVRFERKQCGLFFFCLIILSFCIIANAYYPGMLLH